ncbi:MAG: hypothetical protein OQK76_02465 [Gammaproteobacteria bacterium]|nr:hypothetical protein [Gammaproteobacteria bacterium]MCW8909463.1 hypothetical protein [Gammaproteobacteria bacterium]MCW9005655.1 hypothetical protein [Gammaproteobacteria bacterium]MCW9055030.1 hypothetical protein [Gammaproteobacteria bacterium]
MLSKVAIRENYKGPDRRSRIERRVEYDRRDLYRFESFGLDRRSHLPRRTEEILWKHH